MWLGWVAAVGLGLGLGCSVGLCSTNPSSAQEVVPWWRTATIYEVLPRSFKDSDGDGIGDLKGIVEQADYFKEIGVDAIWMTSVDISPAMESDYGVSTYTAPDSMIVTMEDIDALMTKLKQVGVKFLIDFVPNHTSDRHPWFQMSVNTSHPLHQDYRDFYVWRDAKGFTSGGQPVPPNNWLSVVGGSAWTWDDLRQQFYLHQFLEAQPELNFRNPNVVGNMTKIMNFWLDKGVDGLRIDVVPHLFEDANFTNEQPLPGTTGDSWFTLNHTYTKHQPETFELLDYWADLIYQRSLEDGKQRVMILEVYAEALIAKRYYGKGEKDFQVPCNYLLMMKGGHYIQPQTLKDIIDDWIPEDPGNEVANWVVGNHYLTRVSDLYGREMIDTISLLTGILPGMRVVYFGEELGMEKSPVSWSQTVDPWARYQGPDRYQEWSRDPIRTPMQWDDTLSAGFSSNSTTWLPVNPNYWWLNVAAQRAAPVSHLKVFQALTKARQDPVLQRGDLRVIVPDNTTLLVIRSYNRAMYVLLANLGDVPATFTSQSLFSRHGLDVEMTVVVGSVHSQFQTGLKLNAGSLNVTLEPKAAILLRSGDSPSCATARSQLLTSGLFKVASILLVLFSVIKQTITV